MSTIHQERRFGELGTSHDFNSSPLEGNVLKSIKTPNAFDMIFISSCPI